MSYSTEANFGIGVHVTDLSEEDLQRLTRDDMRHYLDELLKDSKDKVSWNPIGFAPNRQTSWIVTIKNLFEDGIVEIPNKIRDFQELLKKKDLDCTEVGEVGGKHTY